MIQLSRWFCISLAVLFMLAMAACGDDDDDSSTSPDTTPPVVTLTDPAYGDTFTEGEVVTITATATDENAILKVEFLLDGEIVDTDSSSPYEYNWDTTGYVNSHLWRARAYDSSGNTALSEAVEVFVNNAQPPDVDQFDYVVVISEEVDQYRDNYWAIIVMANDDAVTINSLDVTVDGQSVDMTQSYGYWFGDYFSLTQGAISNISAVIDGVSYSQSIQICYWPEIDFPETFDVTQSYDLSWTLGGDNMWQVIDGYADWYNPDAGSTEYSYDTINLSVSARSHTIPANWLGVPYGVEYYFDLGLYQANWAYTDCFVVISSAGDYNYYWSNDVTGRERDCSAIARAHAQKVLDLIGR